MPIEYGQCAIPNGDYLENLPFGDSSDVLLKPVYSKKILAVIPEFPTNENHMEWIEKVDFLLQYGIDVLLSRNPEVVDPMVDRYYLVYQPSKEDLDISSLKGFIIEHNITPLDGSTR